MPNLTALVHGWRSVLARLRWHVALALVVASGTGVVAAQAVATPAPHSVPAALDPPSLLLAKVYHAGTDLADYWVSEKYDGVRGYWNGHQLMTRGGTPIQAPPWFTAGWPAVALDGELWVGRGKFEVAVSAVRAQTPDDAAWRALRFMVFDLPQDPQAFTQRIGALNAVIAAIGQPWVVAVAQTRATSHAALQSQLNKIVEAGGEGLMLHRGASLYSGTRNGDLLKVKQHEDAEARVTGHQAGRGKHAGALGALWVETVASGNGPLPGVRLKIGTGLSDDQRRNPPPVGSVITYRYRGLTAQGVPRFASFVRAQPAGS